MAVEVKTFGSRRVVLFRWAIAGVLMLLVAAYIVLIFARPIRKDERLDAAEIGLIAIAAVVIGVVLNPGLLSRVTNVKLAGLEVELQQLKQDQREQKDELDDVRMVLTLLLSDFEINHLRNLYRGDTREYVGCGPLRAELRKLRDLRLIKKKKDRNIGELWDGRGLDLREIAELTRLGQRFLDRLGDYKGQDGA